MRIFKEKGLFAFWVKIALFFVIIITGSVFLGKITDSSLNGGFLYSYKDKLQTLEKTNGQKTVFLGGSSALFGISAENYEKLSGETAVNMGLNAGAYDLYLSTALPHINKGDVAVLAFEFEAYTSDWYKFDSIVMDLGHISKTYFKTLPLKYKGVYLYKQSLRYYEKSFNLISNLAKRVTKDDDSIYKRANINKYGDINKESIVGNKDIATPQKFKTEINRDSLNKILKYIQALEEKGVKVYIVYPPRFAPENDEGIEKMDKELRAFFGDRILGDVNDWICKTGDDFYDTVYHLNSVGVVKHTEYIFELLSRGK